MSEDKRTLFEGQPVKEMVLGLTGKTDQAPGVQAHHIGDEVTVLVVGTVTKITHQDKDTGLVRTHTVKMSEAHLLDDGDAWELLAEAREKDQKLLDEMLGRRSLWDGDDPNPETGEIG